MHRHHAPVPTSDPDSVEDGRRHRRNSTTPSSSVRPSVNAPEPPPSTPTRTHHDHPAPRPSSLLCNRLQHVLILSVASILLIQLFFLYAPPSTDAPLSPDAACLFNAKSTTARQFFKGLGHRDRMPLADDELDAALSAAADRNGTVMLVPFNQAFVMLMSNLVCSWEKLYVREKGAKRWPVVFWPMDRISYEWAVGRGLEPILHNKSSYGVMEYAGFEKGKSEGDPGYLRMVRQRSKLIRRIVHDLGYNLFVLDSDSVLLKDPMSLLKWDSTLEIQIDGWDEDFVDIPQLPAPQGPAEIRGKEMTSAEKRAAALAGPAKAPTLSYFRPESSWPHDSAPAGSAGAFFLQANAAGRQLALHLDLLLTSQPTFDDTKALNLLARDYAWYRNLSPSSLSATSPAGSNATKTSLDISGRYFTVRFMGEEAVNGPVFFGPRRKRWDALRENGTVPTPAFVHANGTPNKRWAMRDAGVWLLNGQGDCPEEEKPGGPFNFSKPVQ